MVTTIPKKKEPTEPKVRRDGLCYVCKKERPIGAVRNLDPFCSSPCCRQHYGSALAS